MPETDLQILLRGADAAGKIALKHFKNAPKTWDKGGGQGPVTEADLEIDRMLHGDLLAARPDYGWLSEESTDTSDRLGKRNVFIADPIDGTRSFVNGDGTFAHSLAIAEDGIVIAAVVYLPVHKLLFHAAKAQGAFLNGLKIQRIDRQTLRDARILAAKPQMDPDLWPGGVPNVTRHFRSSLAYRMCLAANREFDGMITLRDAWEWDIAAGDLICREAGLISTDRNNKPLKFNNPHPQTAGVLAAGPVVHTGLMKHLQPLPDTV